MKLRFNLETFKNLIEDRKEKGITLRTISKKYAEIKGISDEAAYQFLHAIYRGRRPSPTDLQTISAIAEALNVSPEILLRLENEQTYKLSQDKQNYSTCVKKVIYYIKESYTGLLTDIELERKAVFKEEIYVTAKDRDRMLIGIIVESDYMCPRIYPNDKIVCSLDEKVREGDLVVIHPQTGNLHIGILKELSKRKIVIEPWDIHKHAAKVFKQSDIMNIGKVIELKFA